MLRTVIVAIVTRCTRRAWLVIALSTILGAISGVYAIQHFAINTDINKLISPDLPWRKRDLAFEQAARVEQARQQDQRRLGHRSDLDLVAELDGAVGRDAEESLGGRSRMRQRNEEVASPLAEVRAG